MDITRRSFIGGAASAAAGMMAGCGTAGAVRGKEAPIWAALLHMGTNMWSDQPITEWGPYKGEQLKLVCQSDRLRFDERVWRSLTGRMAEVGMNMVIIDLGEALQYPSHPELWVEGSWEIERFRKELARLRAMGLEPLRIRPLSPAKHIFSHVEWHMNAYELFLADPAQPNAAEGLVFLSAAELCAQYTLPSAHAAWRDVVLGS
jgi:hypothetical protein